MLLPDGRSSVESSLSEVRSEKRYWLGALATRLLKPASLKPVLVSELLELDDIPEESVNRTMSGRSSLSKSAVLFVYEKFVKVLSAAGRVNLGRRLNTSPSSFGVLKAAIAGVCSTALCGSAAKLLVACD